MKGIVIYRGKYGATTQYATWLGETLEMPVHEIERLSIDDLAAYEYLIIGSPVYIGRMLIKDWLQKNADFLSHKKVLFFVVCGSAGDQQKQESIIRQNIPIQLTGSSEIYFLPGRVELSKLSWFDRLLIKVGAFLEKDPHKKQMMLRGYDAVRREYTYPLIKSILNYSKAEVV
jgi:menaquinone-dependent protoporphyrinogen IX oxidase